MDSHLGVLLLCASHMFRESDQPDIAILLRGTKGGQDLVLGRVPTAGRGFLGAEVGRGPPGIVVNTPQVAHSQCPSAISLVGDHHVTEYTHKPYGLALGGCRSLIEFCGCEMSDLALWEMPMMGRLHTVRGDFSGLASKSLGPCRRRTEARKSLATRLGPCPLAGELAEGPERA